ncbi:MAG TPA: nitrite reductase (NAD(P)H) small subunit [Iamia sp.]
MIPVCALADLQPGRGVRALVEGRAVAVFRLDDDGPDHHGLRAIDDVDPYADASVLSRGLLGVTRRGDGLVHYVASPLRKQRFDLATGEELDGPARIATWAVAVVDGVVHVTSGGRVDSHRGNEGETRT